jgi:hypothetical protein
MISKPFYIGRSSEDIVGTGQVHSMTAARNPYQSFLLYESGPSSKFSSVGQRTNSCNAPAFLQWSAHRLPRPSLSGSMPAPSQGDFMIGQDAALMPPVPLWSFRWPIRSADPASLPDGN